MRAEWKGRTLFAEVAETVGVVTNSVVAAQATRDGWLALWTADDADPEDLDTPVFGAVLQRDEDGVLRPIAAPRSIMTMGTLGGLMGQ
jgi:hypothetical protein